MEGLLSTCPKLNNTNGSTGSPLHQLNHSNDHEFHHNLQSGKDHGHLSKSSPDREEEGVGGGGCEVRIEEEPSEEVDIEINNVVCNFSTRCHLNLRQVAMKGSNVVYKREQGMVSMKMRRPKVTASIWSSGKITVTGATSNEEAKKGGRRIARALQKMGFRVRFSAYRVVNVLGTVILPFGIKIAQFTQEHYRDCSYEPELHPGATYRHKESKGVMKIFQTGAITVTAPSIDHVQLAIEHIYPLVYVFKKDKPPRAIEASMKRKRLREEEENKRKKEKKACLIDSSEDEESDSQFTNSEEEGLDESYFSDKSGD